MLQFANLKLAVELSWIHVIKYSSHTNTVSLSLQMKPNYNKNYCDKLTQRQAADGRDRGGVCSRSAGQRLGVDSRRLVGHCRQFYRKSPAGHHTVSHLWTEAWGELSEKKPGCGLDCPLHQGWEYSVSYWKQKKKHKETLWTDSPCYNSSIFLLSWSCLILPFV